ncbi:MAG TPA: M1 family metallopeptidase [Candidatus Angelobacter sp.]|nr:M1 family metallopeptidase [Candidatus Angelobacter sp.]
MKKTAFFLILLCSALCFAQRLPTNVIPRHYSLSFTPDLQKATFSGEETIEVDLAKGASDVTMNSAEIEIQQAEATQGQNTQPANASFDEAKEQVTLSVPNVLEAGPASIHIKFTGKLNSQLRGFYLAHSSTRNYAVTQFENTDARRAFPSFDEPAMKAVFDVTVVADQGDTAISNGKIVSDTSGPVPGKHTIQFAPTPKMSTYLVAMAVGDFVCNEGSADNIPVRVCGTPDKKPLGTAALRYAEEILHYYNTYYGIPYPFGKLDIVGAPDFEAGAMENTAAIFYRESLLLIDDQHASVRSHQQVFEVLAHEMAHQWFGDLVTMKWWDNVWLNEGFATWMELKPSQALHPEWNALAQGVNATNRALAVDSLRNTHAIRARAETPEEINQMFDPISYEKGAAVLRMLETYVTPDVFRRGVNSYLRKFAYSNATAEDFWQAMTLASGRPVNKVMPTFIDQPGEPLITVKTSCTAPPPEPKTARKKSKRSRTRQIAPAKPKLEITLEQTRFLADPGPRADNPTWMVPVCVKTEGGRPFCQVVSEKQQSLPAAGCASWVFVNANASGYYRTHYDAELLKKLSAIAMTSLSSAERLSLVNDEAALVGSGQESAANYLDLVSALKDDNERAILESIGPVLAGIHDYYLKPTDRAGFAAWVRATFGPQLEKLGWSPQPGEKDDQRAARALLVQILGEAGEDSRVISESVAVSHQYINNPAAVDGSLAHSALRVAALSNDPQLFNELMTVIAKPGNTPEQIDNYSEALTRFSDMALVTRWLDRIVGPETRNQDAAGYLGRELRNVNVQQPVWDWIRQHWPAVESKLTFGNGAAIVGSTGAFCEAGLRDQAQQFFSEHKVSSTERALKQSLEQSNRCINTRPRLGGEIGTWLQQQSGAAASAGR